MYQHTNEYMSILVLTTLHKMSLSNDTYVCKYLQAVGFHLGTKYILQVHSNLFTYPVTYISYGNLQELGAVRINQFIPRRCD